MYLTGDFSLRVFRSSLLQFSLFRLRPDEGQQEIMETLPLRELCRLHPTSCRLVLLQ